MDFLSRWELQLGNHSKMMDEFIKESKKLCNEYEYRKSQKVVLYISEASETTHTPHSNPPHHCSLSSGICMREVDND